jgi:uncharacterized membrane protein
MIKKTCNAGPHLIQSIYHMVSTISSSYKAIPMLCFHMHLVRLSISKFLAANVAFIFHGTSVYTTYVAFQVVHTKKTFATELANISICAIVLAHVDLQCVLIPQSFSTYVTNVKAGHNL